MAFDTIFKIAHLLFQMILFDLLSVVLVATVARVGYIVRWVAHSTVLIAAAAMVQREGVLKQARRCPRAAGVTSRTFHAKQTPVHIGLLVTGLAVCR